MHEEDLTTKEIIRRFCEADKEGGRHDVVEGIYHSSSVWQCFRKQYYERAGLPSEKPFGLFEMGRRVEDVLEDSLIAYHGRAFVLNSVPIEIKRDGYVITGSTDPVVIGPNVSFRVLYECKSSRAGWKTKTKGAHKHQAAMYASVLKPQRVLIVHPDRNDVLNMPDEDTDITAAIPFLYEEGLEWFDRFHAYVTNEQLPPAQPVSDGECKWCSFKDRCREDGGWKKSGRGFSREAEALTDE